MQPWFTVYFIDIGHQCYDQLRPVKTIYLLTSITWPYRGLEFTAHRDHVFFFKLTADQMLNFDWIAGSCQVNLLKKQQQQQQQHLFKHDKNYSGADVVVYLRS